jgi:hypothetical protein
VAVDRKRRIRFVPGQHLIDCRPGRRERRVVEPAFREHRGIAGRDQQHVPLAQRHIEPFGEMQDHVAARPGPPGLQKRQVPGRDVGLQSEVELAHAAALAPFAQMPADRPELLGHGGDHKAPSGPAQLPAT